MTNEEYIHLNREADIRPLALKKAPEGVDVSWCLRQIEGYQLAKRKLPSWSEIEGIWYPPRLSMEQCSSEPAAEYKRTIAARLAGNQKGAFLVDLTGGFGVDFAYMAQKFRNALYVERQEVLCDAARHNFQLLGLKQAQVLNADSAEVLDSIETVDVIYMDPARRSSSGRKTVAIADCTPDIVSMQEKLLCKGKYVIVKLSPMLDISQALGALKNVKEVHVVSVKGECKELLFVLEAVLGEVSAVTFYCVNLDTKDAPLIALCSAHGRAEIAIVSHEGLKGMLLFEPNASILKGGMQAEFSAQYGVRQLHPQSNLFVCTQNKCKSMGEDGFLHIPARSFRIVEATDFSRQALKTILKDTPRGNLTVRNFPATVSDLRKKLKLQDGGDTYFFATTLHDGKHALIKCRKR